MSYTETKSEGLNRSYTITIPAKTIEDKKEEKLLKVGETAKVDGFRPGKVPLDVLKSKYESSIMGEVVDACVNAAITELFVEEKVKPAGQPKVEITKFDEGSDMEVSMEVEIIPEIPELDFSKITIEKPSLTVKEEAVNETLENIAKANMVSEATNEKRDVVPGDLVSIAFDGKIDGERKPGMKAEEYDLELGSNTFIPGFEDQVVGMTVGDTKDITVTFPENYGAKDLAGKEAVFTVTINSLKTKSVPAIDDELAKKMQCTDLADLKEKIKSSIDHEQNELIDMAVKRIMLDTLDSQVKVELPESLTKAEFEEIWKRVESDRKANPEGPDYKGKSEEELKKEYQGIADRRVKLGLVLADVGNKNKISVSNSEINQAISIEMKKYPGQEKKVLEYYQKNPNAVATLQAPLFEKKVMDFILELANTKEKEMSVEEVKAIIER